MTVSTATRRNETMTVAVTMIDPLLPHVDSIGARRVKTKRPAPAHAAKIITAGASATALFTMIAAMGWQAGIGSATPQPPQTDQPVITDPAIVVPSVVQPSVVATSSIPIVNIPAVTVPTVPGTVTAASPVSAAGPVVVPAAKPATKTVTRTVTKTVAKPVQKKLVQVSTHRASQTVTKSSG